MADAQQASQWLHNTLDARREVRQESERALLQASKQENFCIFLLTCISDHQQLPTTQQAAAIYFKNMVRSRWAPGSDDIIAPEEKARVRDQVLNAMLSTHNRNIREAISSAIASIAEVDFPGQWPGLVNRFVEIMASGDPSKVIGVLFAAHSIFQRYRLTHELTEQHKSELLPLVITFGEPMLQLTQSLWKSVEVGQGDLHVMFEALNLLLQIFYDLNFHDMAEFFANNLSKFMEIFGKSLAYINPALTSPTDDPGVYENNKVLVLECLSLYPAKFDEEFKPYVQSFLGTVWETLKHVSTEQRDDEVAHGAMKFLSDLCNSQHWGLFRPLLKEVCEQVVVPNVELRESDTEMFDTDSVEFIRRDIEVGERHTRRSSACLLIRGLARHYEADITPFFQQFLQYLLEQYKGNQDDRWKKKSTALYLVTTLMPKTQGTFSGLNQLANVGQFYGEHVLPELQQGAPEAHLGSLMVKAECIKFVTTFKNHLDKEACKSVMQLLVQWVGSSSSVVHTYAASCIESILALKAEAQAEARVFFGEHRTKGGRQQEGQGVMGPRVPREEWRHLLEGLLTVTVRKIGDTIADRPNEHLARLITRIFVSAKDYCAPYVPPVLDVLLGVLGKVYKQPTNPAFNHYLFEALNALVKHNPGSLGEAELSMKNAFDAILKDGAEEFVPYVFQSFAQLLGITRNVGMYTHLVPPLLAPMLYQNKGNIPAAIQLLTVFIQREPQSVSGALEPTLGVMQNLVSTKLYDDQGCKLLIAVFTHLSRQQLEPLWGQIFGILLRRLQQQFTQKFAKWFVIVTSAFINKFGPDQFLGVVEGIQIGLTGQILPNVYLRWVNSVTEPEPRRGCIVALTKFLTESDQLAGPMHALRQPVEEALAQLLDAGTQGATAEEEDLELPDMESEGWQTRHHTLNNVVVRQDVGPLVDPALNPKMHVLTALQSAASRMDGKGNLCRALLSSPAWGARLTI